MEWLASRVWSRPVAGAADTAKSTDPRRVEGFYPPDLARVKRASRRFFADVKGFADPHGVPLGRTGCTLEKRRFRALPGCLMLTIPSLLAAMTIAGAFWVGVLAARRLRDWGDGRRVLEEGEAPLALSAATSAPADEAASRRVRARVAERLGSGLANVRAAAPISRRTQELTFDSLRTGDVVSIETPENRFDGDYLIEGLVRMRDGASATVTAVLADGNTRRWLVGSTDRDEQLVLDPVEGHGLVGEPPRNVQRGHKTYSLDRRGQASAASVGRHGRPDGARVSTYVYKSGPHEVLWLERWGAEVLMGEGVAVPRHAVGFLPGS